MTGYYDVPGVLRQIEVVRSQLVAMSRIEGTPEFKDLTMEYVTALRAVLSRTVENLEGWGSDVKVTQAEGEFERTIPKLNEFCGFAEG